MKCVYNILERKEAFLDPKSKKLQKSKNWDFSKSVIYLVNGLVKI